MTRMIDFMPGCACNFRCGYCLEAGGANNYKAVAMPDDVADAASAYVKHVMDKLGVDERMILRFLGGEPMLYTDVMQRVVDSIPDNRIVLRIVTNGSLIESKGDWLLSVNEQLGGRLDVVVSYDYALQDENRQQGTYEQVRNGIRWLPAHGLGVRTLSCIPFCDLHRIYDVYRDFRKLRREIPSLDLPFNVPYVGEIDEEKTREALSLVREVMQRTGTLGIMYRNRSHVHRETSQPGCVYSNIYAGINVDGNIYPAYSIIHDADKRSLYYMGNVKEDFALLDEKHDALLSRVNFEKPSACLECEAPCYVIPWESAKSDVSETFGMPDPRACRASKLIGEYL